MTARTPLITLFAAVVLGLVLLTVNRQGDPANQIAGRPAAAVAPVATVSTQPRATTAPPATTAPRTTTPAPRTTTPAAAPLRAYDGRVTRGGLTVSIAVKGDRALGYLCDNHGVEFWLSGTVTGPDIALRSADGRATISGTIDETRSTGVVTTGGAPEPYVAAAVDGVPPGVAKALEGKWSV